MTNAQRAVARQRLEDLRGDAIDVRDETPADSYTYGHLVVIVREYDAAIDELRFP